MAGSCKLIVSVSKVSVISVFRSRERLNKCDIGPSEESKWPVGPVIAIAHSRFGKSILDWSGLPGTKVSRCEAELKAELKAELRGTK